MLRQDYIKRIIEQLGQALARIAGLRATPAAVLDEVRAAKKQLPVVPGLLESSSPNTLTQIVGSREVLGQIAELYRAEGEAHKQQGNPREAARCMKRSLDLLNVLGDANGSM